MPVNSICAHCGTQFSTRPYKIRSGRPLYCSTDCMHAARLRQITCTCQYCGRTFSRKSSDIKKKGHGQFCSNDCSYQARTITLLERFAEHVQWTNDDGCQVWIGGATLGGYGVIGGEGGRNGSQLLAHRVAWELANGPIPEGLFVCHHCDNPPCVRVDHLFLGTHWENMADMRTKHRHHGPNRIRPTKTKTDPDKPRILSR